MHRFVGILGVIFIIGLCYVFSTNRRAIRYKTVAWGLGLQIALAFLVMRWSVGQLFFSKLGRRRQVAPEFFLLRLLLRLWRLGTKQFAARLLLRLSGASHHHFYRSVFRPPLLLGIMQVIVKAMAQVMTRLMGASGAESLNVAASIFMGQTEAPLTIRPFLPEVTRSELMTIMTSGMAHVSGSMMGAYMAYGIEAEHLLAAVIMTAPGTILIAKMLVPETEKPLTADAWRVPKWLEMEEGRRRTFSARSRAAPLTACTWPSTLPPCSSLSSR